MNLKPGDLIRTNYNTKESWIRAYFENGDPTVGERNIFDGAVMMYLGKEKAKLGHQAMGYMLAEYMIKVLYDGRVYWIYDAFIKDLFEKVTD